MCAIVGSLNLFAADPTSLIRAMADKLVHRGPDYGKVINLDPLVLAHRRLSIIDLSDAAHQPMFDCSRRFCIAFNGEIYNYQTLKRQLQAKGATFVTNSDTEVILEAWKMWGAASLGKLQGMFAFAIWDTQTSKLVLARDRIGEKPLYYGLLKKAGAIYGIVFASTMDVLLMHPKLGKNINMQALSQYLSLNYVLSNNTMVQAIEKLPPGSFLQMQNDTLQIDSYWQLADFFKQSKQTNQRQAIDKLNDLLASSVKSQTVSDVPLGAFLSGGLDSSTIVACLSNIVPNDLLQTFSAGFREKSYNEIDKSKYVADYLQIANHNVSYVDNNIHEDIFKIVNSFDEPFADSSMIPMYYLAKFAKNKVTVCLSGDAGDELFAGYETYVADSMHRVVRHMPRPLANMLAKIVQKSLPTSFAKMSFDYKLKKFCQGLTYDAVTAHYSWRTIFSEQEKADIVNENYRGVLDYNPVAYFKQLQRDVSDCDWLDQLLYLDMKTWLVDDILVKVDRSCMAHSLESRIPMLNHQFVEFVATLPSSWKLNYWRKKHILALSQQHKLPKDICQQQKKGFNAPIAYWLIENKQLHNLAKELTLGTDLEWFSKTAIEALWQEHQAKKRDHSLKLFGLMVLSMWMDNFKATQKTYTEATHDFYSNSSV